VLKEHSAAGDPIEVRRAHHVIDSPRFVCFGVNAGTPSPIVGEREQNIRSVCVSRVCRAKADQSGNGQTSDQNEETNW
jgi:hypothetical protein